VFKKDGNELEWVVDLDPRLEQQPVQAAPRGLPRGVPRQRKRQAAFSVVKDITVTGGRASTIDL
jgi:hypothetical protein